MTKPYDYTDSELRALAIFGPDDGPAHCRIIRDLAMSFLHERSKLNASTPSQPAAAEGFAAGIERTAYAMRDAKMLLEGIAKQKLPVSATARVVAKQLGAGISLIDRALTAPASSEGEK